MPMPSRELQLLLFNTVTDFISLRGKISGVPDWDPEESRSDVWNSLPVHLVSALWKRLVPAKCLWLFEVSRTGETELEWRLEGGAFATIDEHEGQSLQREKIGPYWQILEKVLPKERSQARTMRLEADWMETDPEPQSALLLVEPGATKAPKSDFHDWGLVILAFSEGEGGRPELLPELVRRLEGLGSYFQCHSALLRVYQSAREQAASLEQRNRYSRKVDLTRKVQVWERNLVLGETDATRGEKWIAEAAELAKELWELGSELADWTQLGLRLAESLSGWSLVSGLDSRITDTGSRKGYESRSKLVDHLENLVEQEHSKARVGTSPKISVGTAEPHRAARLMRAARIGVLARIVSGRDERIGGDGRAGGGPFEESRWQFSWTAKDVGHRLETAKDRAEYARSVKSALLQRHWLIVDRAISRWTRLLAEVESSKDRYSSNLSGTPGEPGARWLEEEDVEGLASILKSRFDSEKKKGFDSRYMPTWLRLWFCHELLTMACNQAKFEDRPVSSVQKWRFRRDLAYSIRECLRSLNYGHRYDFVYKPAEYTAALLTLVEHHARWVLDVPKVLDIRRFLETIGRSHDPTSSLGSSHLQHALEVYVAGIFLAQTEVESGAEGKDLREMARVLASGASEDAGELRTREFKKAFALSALFHDAGMVILPKISSHHLDELSSDRQLRSKLEEFRRSETAIQSQLMQSCKDELVGAGYFSEKSEAEIVEWMEETAEMGEPDHSLIGAWYLHRLFVKGDGTPEAEITRAVVRTTLLHRCDGQVVDAAEDPVAALLIICDELFDWSPSLVSQMTPDRVGRAFYSFVADQSPRNSRFSRLRLPGLEIDNETGRLRGVWRFPEGEKARVWPAFELEFLPHETLDRPIYHYWLLCAQNLERIDTSESVTDRFDGGRAAVTRWRPRITLASKRPPELQEEGLDLSSTKDLLAEASEHCGPLLAGALDEWLGVDERFDSVDPGTGGKEKLLVRCCGQAWQGRGLRNHLDELDTAVDSAYRERRYQAVRRRLYTVSAPDAGEPGAASDTDGDPKARAKAEES